MTKQGADLAILTGTSNLEYQKTFNVKNGSSS